MTEARGVGRTGGGARDDGNQAILQQPHNAERHGPTMLNVPASIDDFDDVPRIVCPGWALAGEYLGGIHVLGRSRESGGHL